MSGQKKILLINYEYPPLGGGAGNASWHTARELARLGCLVTVVTSMFRGLARRETADGVDIIRIPTLRKKKSASTGFEAAVFGLSALLRMPGIARRVKPDAVLCYFSIPCGPAALLARILFGVPYILSLRGLDVPGGRYKVAFRNQYRFAGSINKFIWKKAAAVTTNSENLRNFVVEIMPGLEVGVVPNGVDTSRFSPGKRSDKYEKKIVALYSGRLVEYKGVAESIAALGMIKDMLPEDFVYVIAGDGADGARLRAAASDEGVESTVEFIGWVDRDDMPDIYRNADFLVLPSKEEGMPNVILEAMASGLPVIATDIPDCEAMVRHGVNGFIVPRDRQTYSPDVKDLGEAILKLAADAEMRVKMGAESARLAAGYSWTETARKFLSIINSHIASSS